jgi:glutamate synthase (NADPH) large chain
MSARAWPAVGSSSSRPPGIRYRAATTPIMGNTCLYGATGGQLFACRHRRRALCRAQLRRHNRGRGRRRPCCEYMTGGVVVILGRTGINFGAGMTGGFAYVLDTDRGFVDRYNHELIDIHHIEPDNMENHVHHLRGLIEQHLDMTGSAWPAILDDFRRLLPKFWLVKPKATDLDSLISRLREAA